MNEMIERVARAICVKRGIDPDARVCQEPPHFLIGERGHAFFAPAEDKVYPAWYLFGADASAAIQAMRTPTQAMCLAATSEAAKEQARPIAIRVHDVEQLWQAMIDAALKG